jgi:hypothetical protein
MYLTIHDQAWANALIKTNSTIRRGLYKMYSAIKVEIMDVDGILISSYNFLLCINLLFF